MNGKAKSNSSRDSEVWELPVLPPVSKEGPVGFRKEKSGAFAFQIIQFPV